MVLPSGRSPFREWLRELRDIRAKQRIAARLVRLEQGAVGECRPVGAGVSELRIDTGPGYRVYFGIRQAAVVVIVAGGAKGTQERDIAQSQAWWKECRHADD